MIRVSHSSQRLYLSKHIPEREKDTTGNHSGNNFVVPGSTASDVFDQLIQSGYVGRELTHQCSRPTQRSTLSEQILSDGIGLTQNVSRGVHGILNVIPFSEQMIHGGVGTRRCRGGGSPRSRTKKLSPFLGPTHGKYTLVVIASQIQQYLPVPFDGGLLTTGSGRSSKASGNQIL